MIFIRSCYSLSGHSVIIIRLVTCSSFCESASRGFMQLMLKGAYSYSFVRFLLGGWGGRGVERHNVVICLTLVRPTSRG